MNDKTTPSRVGKTGSGRTRTAGRSRVSARREAILVQKPTVRRGRKAANAEATKAVKANKLAPLLETARVEAADASCLVADVAVTDPKQEASAPAEPQANSKASPIVDASPFEPEAPALAEAAPIDTASVADPVLETTPAEPETSREAVPPQTPTRPARKPRKVPAAKPPVAPTAAPNMTSAAMTAAGRSIEPASKPSRKSKAARSGSVVAPAPTLQPTLDSRRPTTSPTAGLPGTVSAAKSAGAPTDVAMRVSGEIGAEMVRFAEGAVAAGGDGLRDAIAAKSLPEFIEWQARSAQVAAGLWVQHSTRMSEICKTALRDIGAAR